VTLDDAHGFPILARQDWCFRASPCNLIARNEQAESPLDLSLIGLRSKFFHHRADFISV
jgi:hypothetical protein